MKHVLVSSNANTTYNRLSRVTRYHTRSFSDVERVIVWLMLNYPDVKPSLMGANNAVFLATNHSENKQLLVRVTEKDKHWTVKIVKEL